MIIPFDRLLRFDNGARRRHELLVASVFLHNFWRAMIAKRIKFKCSGEVWRRNLVPPMVFFVLFGCASFVISDADKQNAFGIIFGIITLLPIVLFVAVRFLYLSMWSARMEIDRGNHCICWAEGALYKSRLTLKNSNISRMDIIIRASGYFGAPHIVICTSNGENHKIGKGIGRTNLLRLMQVLETCQRCIKENGSDD